MYSLIAHTDIDGPMEHVDRIGEFSTYRSAYRAALAYASEAAQFPVRRTWTIEIDGVGRRRAIALDTDDMLHITADPCDALTSR